MGGSLRGIFCAETIRSRLETFGLYTPSSCVANNIEGKFYNVIATVLENVNNCYALRWSNFSPIPFE